jgi:hypothetical protein
LRACDLTSLVDYFNAKTCDIWKRNVTTKREFLTEHIHSLGLGDIREGLTLWRVILQ